MDKCVLETYFRWFVGIFWEICKKAARYSYWKLIFIFYSLVSRFCITFYKTNMFFWLHKCYWLLVTAAELNIFTVLTAKKSRFNTTSEVANQIFLLHAMVYPQTLCPKMCIKDRYTEDYVLFISHCRSIPVAFVFNGFISIITVQSTARLMYFSLILLMNILFQDKHYNTHARSV